MNDLLKVLDMSEDEQHQWVDDNCEMEGWESKSSGFVPTESLADLAFRLRDEAVKENQKTFHNGIHEVMLHVVGDDRWATAFWGEEYAKPIHWIVASLIAKEKANA